MKRFVIGDIHGAFKALVQCLQRSSFDYDHDLLILLGDIVDGYYETRQVVDELLKIKNLVFVRGNHDEWFINWILHSTKEPLWILQGGSATLESYNYSKENVPKLHVDLFISSVYYYVLDNKIFVHGGISLVRDVNKISKTYLLWDRSLFYKSRNEADEKNPKKYSKYDEVYLGHTQTKSKSVENYGNVWNLDSGAGYNGVLSILNIDTKEIFTSDNVIKLYPSESIKRNIVQITTNY